MAALLEADFASAARIASDGADCPRRRSAPVEILLGAQGRP
jgi:hypothetical protein